MQHVGVIGLGGMGLALVASLRQAGYPVCCFDKRVVETSQQVPDGVTFGQSPRDVAENSDVVMTFLPGPTEVESVALEPETGVLSGLRVGSSMLDLSTCGIDTAKRLSMAFHEADRTFIDCPVSRKAPHMTVLVGGVDSDLGENAQVLADVSDHLVYCGGLGSGYAVKLLNQHIKYTAYLASSEAFLIAEGLGINASTVAGAIALCSGGESALDTASEYFMNDLDAMNSHAPARTIGKDASLASQLAAEAGVESPSLDALVDFFNVVSTTPYHDLPFPRSTELLRTIRTQTRRSGAE